ncbi:MAG: substrate-binding domain-containing protein [Anaerolineales bacterium]|nr:substrate-binding domain-containing protein [Anaerolineales bacterium]
MSQKKRVTIHQVAKEANVSRQTVSRVINNRPDVAPETRERVQEVIERLGYRPSAIARSLIQQRSYTIGVVIAGLKFVGPSRTLNGITEMAEEMGYGLLLKELLGFTTNDVDPLLQWFLSRQVDGIIWAVPEVGENRDWLQDQLPDLSVPLIFLTMQVQKGLSIVSVDNYLGGRMATEHLIEQGKDKIGHISGPLDWWEAQQRKQGWLDALLDANLRVDEKFAAEGNWSSRSGEQAFQRLLDDYPGMNGVFVGNDQMALSVIQIACRDGIKIPDELAVVGFDGIPDAAYYWPPLTTIYQDQYKVGCTAVQTLVELIEAWQRGETDLEPKMTIIEPELIVRESTKSVQPAG